MLFVCGCAFAFAQGDPTLDSKGLPKYLKLLAKPAPEPWSKITEEQRFHLYASLTFSPYAGLSSAAAGGIGQAINSPKEWGQGWGAYGLRTASSFGSSFVAYTITYGTSAIFRDDNRYFRSNQAAFGARFRHVITSPYFAHSDSGKTRFSTSSFLGGAGGASISLLWSPPGWQGLSNVGINYAAWYAGLAGVNLIREFYPSLVRHHRNKSHGKGTPTNPAHPNYGNFASQST